MKSVAINSTRSRHLLLQYVAAVNEHREADAKQLFDQLWGRA